MSRLERSDIKYLPGVGPKRAELLASELHIHTFHDMLYYFPFRYVDRSTIFKIADLQGEMPSIQLKGHFVNFVTQGEGAKRRLVALFSDGTGTVEVVWFNRIKTIAQTYHTGTEYILFGKPTLFKNSYSIIHPEVDIYKPEIPPTGLVGVYNLTEKLRNRSFTSRTMQKLEATLLDNIAVERLPESLPPSIIAKRGLMPLGESLRNLHQPADIPSLQRAQYRQKYEELFFLELDILKNIKGQSRKLPGLPFAHVGTLFNGFYHNYLPFPLTNAQKRVIREIRHDTGSGHQMNRLLQGDVGSGKTIVAFLSMLLALDNGYQACIMAPTEILAEQHLQTIMGFLKGMDIRDFLRK